jgi:uncharacterized protein YjbJ (UPF0337 family)
MNKDRVEGVVKQASGKIKQATGRAMGDTKLETEGKAEVVGGKIQNAIGGMKDALKK